LDQIDAGEAVSKPVVRGRLRLSDPRSMTAKPSPSQDTDLAFGVRVVA